MKIKMIAAHDLSKNIGIDNKLPWHLPEDLKHFKNYTTGQIIVMGTNTFKSLGKALPSRRNVVISRSLNHESDYNTKDIEFFYSIEAMLDMLNDEKEIIIIGGASIYEQFLNLNIIDELVITEVIGEYEGDTKFPEYLSFFDLDDSKSEFDLVSKNGTNYNIKYYKKK